MVGLWGMKNFRKLLFNGLFFCFFSLSGAILCTHAFAQTLDTTPQASSPEKDAEYYQNLKKEHPYAKDRGYGNPYAYDEIVSQFGSSSAQNKDDGTKNPFEAKDFIRLSTEADADKMAQQYDELQKLNNVIVYNIKSAREEIIKYINESKLYENTPWYHSRSKCADMIIDADNDNEINEGLEYCKKYYSSDQRIINIANELSGLVKERNKTVNKLSDLQGAKKASEAGDDIYEFITEDGQSIFFKKVEYSFLQDTSEEIWGKYESINNTVTKGCVPLPAKIAETRSCIFCPLFLTIFNAAQTMTTNSFDILGSEVAKVILIGFAIFIAFTVLKYVSSMSRQDTPALMNDLLKQGFKIIFACSLLVNPEFIYGKLIGPVLNAGMELGGSLMFNAGSGYTAWCSIDENVNEQTAKFIAGTYDGSATPLKEGLIPAYIYTKVECFIRSVQAEISLTQSIGSTLMCVARHEGSDDEGFVPLPDFSMMIQGFILWAIALVMTIAFAFYLVDATVRLGIVGALMPFFIATWPFKMTAKFSKTGWSMLLNTFFTYVMMALIIGINIELIMQGLTIGGTSADYFEKVINGNDINELRKLLDIGLSGFLIMIFCSLFAFKMTGQAAAMAGQFAGGGGSSIAPQLGTLGLQAAKGVGFGTVKRVGSVMKAAGAAAKASKFKDSAKNKVAGIFGLGRKSNAAAGANQRNAQGGVQGATPQGSGASGANQNQPNPNQPNQPNPNQPNPPVSQQDREFGDALRQEALDQTALRNARQDVAAAQNDANAARGTPQEAAQLKKLQDAQLALQAAQSKANASKQNRENLENLLKNNPNSAYKDPQSLQNKKNFEQSAAALAAAQANRQANVARLQELDRILKSSTDSKTIAKAQQEKNKLSNENAKLDKYISDTKKYNDNLFEKLSNQVGTEEHQKRVDGVNKEIQYYEDNKAYYGNKSGRETYEESISPDKQQQEINSTVQKINENAAAQVAKDAEIAAKQAEIAKQMQLLDNERKMAQTATDKPSKDLYEQQAKERENLINRANQELNALQAQAQNIRNNTQRLNDIRLSLERELPNKQKQWAFYNKFMKPAK